MRHLMLILFLAAGVLTTQVSCKKHAATAVLGQEGIIQKQGMTTYQYGTHILVISTTDQMVLKSTAVDLDKYVNKKVRITAAKTNYTVENGPPLYEVSAVTEIN